MYGAQFPDEFDPGFPDWPVHCACLLPLSIKNLLFMAVHPYYYSESEWIQSQISGRVSLISDQVWLCSSIIIPNKRDSRTFFLFYLIDFKLILRKIFILDFFILWKFYYSRFYFTKAFLLKRNWSVSLWCKTLWTSTLLGLIRNSSCLLKH